MKFEEGGTHFIELEYEALKAEQRQRIATRDNISYLQIVACVALFSLSDKVPSGWNLLMIPFSCVVLGWMFVMNDTKITEIHKYIKGLQAKEKKSDLPAQNLFGWEHYHRDTDGRMIRKIIQFLVSNLIFVFPGAVSAVIVSIGEYGQFEAAIGYLEILVLAILAWQFFAYRDFN